MFVSVIGAGSWGTALAQTLATAGHDVRMWARKPEVCESITHNHINPRYLSDCTLSDRISASCDIEWVVKDTAAVVIVTPSTLMRETALEIKPFITDKTPIVICSKGVEAKTGLLPVEVFEAELSNMSRMAALMGPNHAEEVILGQPSATTVASSDSETAAFFQHLFATETFRTYVDDDVVGAELCAAFKNVIAIAVGVSYGLGFGDNTAAMLMTRGIAEMSRLVLACGGNQRTCMGLAGTGDLIVTCTSKHSRNRTFGYRLALGTTLEQYRQETHMVVEGAYACQTLATLASRYNVELPITDMVRSVVWEGEDPTMVPERMLKRDLRQEFY